jgi:hypothetical protein
MKASAENRRISLLLKLIREESLVPRPDFQRRTVWTSADKVAFIKTILEDYPFPEIYIAASSVDTSSGDAVEMLVDGQQRMRAIEDYFKGATPFRTSRSITAYKDLDEEQKRGFLNYEVAVRNLGINDEAKIREIFTRMNRTSYNLNDMERFNAVYLGVYKKFSETLAENEQIKQWRVFSSTDVRRMKDVSYMASVIATMMSTYFHRDDEIESYLEAYNENFPALPEMNARFMGAVEFIKGLLLPQESRAFRKVDFYNLVVEVDRQLWRQKRKPDLTFTGLMVTDFYKSVDAARHSESANEDVRTYYEATLQNTNDRTQRVIRGQIIQKLLDACPASPFELKIPTAMPELLNLEDEVEVGDLSDLV